MMMMMNLPFAPQMRNENPKRFGAKNESKKDSHNISNIDFYKQQKQVSTK